MEEHVLRIQLHSNGTHPPHSNLIQPHSEWLLNGPLILSTNQRRHVTCMEIIVMFGHLVGITY